jgi:hypothetical protein
MRIVGKLNRSEFEPDPVEALRRGAEIDRKMKLMLPPHPRGVFRGSHAFFNRMDDERAAAMAKIVANAPLAYPDDEVVKTEL